MYVFSYNGMPPYNSIHINRGTSTNLTSWGSLGSPSPSVALISTASRQCNEGLKKKMRSSTYHRIPPRRRRKPLCATSLVRALRDIIEDLRMGVCNRIDETDAAFTGVEALLIDERQDGRQSRRRGRCAIDEGEIAVNGDNIVGSAGNLHQLPSAPVYIACCTMSLLVEQGPVR